MTKYDFVIECCTVLSTLSQKDEIKKEGASPFPIIRQMIKVRLLSYTPKQLNDKQQTQIRSNYKERKSDYLHNNNHP